jgi:hypothetical protein
MSCRCKQNLACRVTPLAAHLPKSLNPAQVQGKRVGRRESGPGLICKLPIRDICVSRHPSTVCSPLPRYLAALLRPCCVISSMQHVRKVPPDAAARMHTRLAHHPRPPLRTRTLHHAEMAAYFAHLVEAL